MEYSDADLDRQGNEERKYMVIRLHDKKYWIQWADGYMSCPICGCSIHPSYKDIHIIWHERNNQ